MKPILRSLYLIPALAAASCSSDSSGDKRGEAGPGLTFSYPLDGQVDVPTQARLIFQFAAPVEAAALDEPCALEGDAAVQGGLCLVGAEGVVPISTEILGEAGAIVAVSSTELLPGADYRVFVRPGLQPAASNLLADQPMLGFRTRRSDSATGAATLISVGGEDPAAFTAGGPPLRRPILDHTTLRLLFSEALDEKSLQLGASANVTLRRTDGTAADVAATVLLQGPHLVVDPDERLADGGSYELAISGLTDRGGNPVTATTLTFSPRATETYPQVVEVDHPGTSAGPGDALSAMTGAPFNSVVKRSSLIGVSTLGLLPGTLRVELGDPGAFGGPIPFMMPKGQRIAASELALKLAGLIDMGYQTGSLYFELVSDANGWVTRNPYRSADQIPDDKESPLIVDLYFDAALVAEDANGHAMATQTHLNIHLTGEATSVDGQLVMEAAGAIEVELLGVSRSTADISLRVRTGAVEMPPSTLEVTPTIVAASPARAETYVALDARPQILVSSALDLGKIIAAGQVTLTSAAGPAQISLRASGGALIVTPRAPLIAGTSYTLTLGTLTDVAGKVVALAPEDATAGTGVITFTTVGVPNGVAVAPQLVAVVPGVPCALTGGTAAIPGRCVGGEGSDPSYQPFTLPADRPVEARFTQPMSAATMLVGAACNQGSIRLEEVNGTTCVAAVAGELSRSMNGFRYQPLAPLKVGARYRFVLVAGANTSCGANELCGANGRPFNPAPLDGLEEAGGSDVVLYFTASEPTRKAGTTAINLSTALVADRNANGTIDTVNERREPSSELAVDVESVGGVVSAASVTGPGPDCRPELPGRQACLGLTADLPVTVLPAVDSCPIDLAGAPATGAGPCVPVRISAQSIQTTNLIISATAVGIDLSNIQTGMMHIRMLERTAEGAVGYIMSGEDGKPVFVVRAQTLMDAPDLSLFLGLVSHDVNSKPINLVLAGPVSFLPDGRMQVVLHNRGAVLIPVNISSAVFDGRITLRVPDGTLTLSLTTPAIR